MTACDQVTKSCRKTSNQSSHNGPCDMQMEVVAHGDHLAPLLRSTFAACFLSCGARLNHHYNVQTGFVQYTLCVLISLHHPPGMCTEYCPLKKHSGGGVGCFAVALHFCPFIHSTQMMSKGFRKSKFYL